MAKNRTSRKHRQMKIYHEKKIHAQNMRKRNNDENQIIEKFLTISDETIKRREKEFQNEQGKTSQEIELKFLTEYTTLAHPEISKHVGVFCSKSGQWLYNHTNESVYELVQNFGISQAAKYLELHNQNQISPVMLRTDSEALRIMSFKNPVNYFCYTVTEMLSDEKTRYNDLIKTRENLQTALSADDGISENNLIRVNEYLRRLMGLSSTVFLMPYFSKTSPVSITETKQSFMLFLAELQGALKAIIKEQLSRSRKKITQHQSIRITDIAEIRAHLRGQRRYSEQKQYREVSDCEALQFDIESVFMDGELDVTVHELRFSSVKTEIKIANQNLEYSAQKRIDSAHEKGQAVQINFGSCSETKTKTASVPDGDSNKNNSTNNSTVSPISTLFSQCLNNLKR